MVGVPEREAVVLTLQVGLAATAASAPFAIAVGLWLARLRGAARMAVEAVAMSPLVLPPIVTGFALLSLFGRQGVFGAALASVGIHLPFTFAGAVLAAGVMGFPLFVRAVKMSAEAVDPGLVDAARTLGASRLRALCTITLPLAAPGVVTGALLAFARSLGEFGATITFAGSAAGQTRTLPLAIWAQLQQPGADPTALVLCSVGLSVGALALSEVVGRAVAVRVGR